MVPVHADATHVPNPSHWPPIGHALPDGVGLLSATSFWQMSSVHGLPSSTGQAAPPVPLLLVALLLLPVPLLLVTVPLPPVPLLLVTVLPPPVPLLLVVGLGSLLQAPMTATGTTNHALHWIPERNFMGPALLAAALDVNSTWLNAQPGAS